MRTFLQTAVKRRFPKRSTICNYLKWVRSVWDQRSMMADITEASIACGVWLYGVLAPGTRTWSATAGLAGQERVVRGRIEGVGGHGVT